MGLDTVDVGGASAYGRPDMPPMVTVDEAGNPMEGSSTAKKDTEVSPNVARATANTPIGASTPVYPNEHQANHMELGADGAIILTQDNEVRKFDKYKPLGDVQKGYVTGRRQSSDSAGVESVVRELEKEVESIQESADHAAKNIVGEPLIEVLFHTDIGIIASYHSKVVESGKWLILIDSAEEASKQKFIPKPSDPPIPMEISIVGRDKNEQLRTVLPLGINFSVDGYDFFVMMVVVSED